MDCAKYRNRETDYEGKLYLESVLDFNYKMKIYFDVTTERQKVVILETKSDESEQNQSMEEMGFMSSKTDDENFSKTDDDNCFKETIKIEVCNDSLSIQEQHSYDENIDTYYLRAQ